MLKLFAPLLIAGTLLTACTASQEAKVLTDTATLCTVAQLANQGDPALAQHNPKAAMLATNVCNAAPALVALVPTTTATTVTVTAPAEVAK